MTFFLVMFVLEGLGLMAASVPFIRRRIKPNNLYGFRVSQTLGDEATWYRVNERFGRWLLGAGGVFTLAAIGLHFVAGVGNSILAYNFLCAALLIAGVATAVIKAYEAI